MDLGGKMTGRPWRAIACWAAALAVSSACRSPRPAEQVEEDNSVNVTVYADGQRRALPASIDRNDPRITSARAELAKLLGHPLAFELDAAAAAKFGPALHRAYVAALEEIATALDDCRRSQPDAFAFGAPQLERVQVHYEPVRSSTYVAPHFDAGVLSGTLHPESLQLFDGSDLCSVFDRELSEERRRRFTGVEPARVAPIDHAAYLDYLFDRGDGELEELETIRLTAELEPRLTNPELSAKASRTLSQQGSTLASGFRQTPDDPALLGALIKAQQAWIAWVNRHGSALDEYPLWNVIDLLFTDRDHHATALELRRGFDSTAFGLPIIEHFVANVASEDTTRTEIRPWMFVVCRARRSKYHERLEVSPKCNGAFYGDLVKTAAGRRELARLLITKRTEVLTQTAIVHSLRTHGAEPVIQLVELLERDDQTLQVALKTLGDFHGWRSRGTAEHPDAVHPRALIDRIPRWWKSLPRERALLLRVLSGTSGSGKEKLPWRELPKFLGDRIDPPTLTAYLAESWQALDELPRLMPSLSPGWARSRVVMPALERWLDAQAEGRLGDANPYHAATSAANALCESGIVTDFDDMQRDLRRRAERYPSQMKRIESFYRGSRSEVCPYRRPEEEADKAPVERVDFGD